MIPGKALDRFLNYLERCLIVWMIFSTTMTLFGVWKVLELVGFIE